MTDEDNKHLNDKTRRVLPLSLDERIQWVNMRHFVMTEPAARLLDQLENAFQQTSARDFYDFPSDVDTFSVIGGTGLGKSSIFQYFRSLHPPLHFPDHEEYPVQHCILKDAITNMKGLYSGMLAPYHHPLSDPVSTRVKRPTIDQYENTLIYTMNRTRTRVFFVDDFQHLKGLNMEPLLNQFKRMALVSRVPLVPAGLPVITQIFEQDLQLADRFPVKEFSVLHYWSYNDSFRSFIKGYEEFLPFPEPSKLWSTRLSKMIFDKVKFRPVEIESLKRLGADERDYFADPEGQQENESKEYTNLRRTVRLLRDLAKDALMNHKRCITEDDIEKKRVKSTPDSSDAE